MIEKLKRPVKIGGTTFREKINELVDAVNELQKQYDSVCIWVGEQKLNYNPDTTKGLSTLVEEPEPADPYAEQRKWIGKVCWFWDANKEAKSCGILTEIVPENHDYKGQICPYLIDDSGEGYMHCEPVKPDSDIIYKGEQQ